MPDTQLSADAGEVAGGVLGGSNRSSQHLRELGACDGCGESAAGGAGISRADALARAAERCLSFTEREEIALLRARDFGVRAIARCLGRSPSTISRELRRNASTRSYHLEYRASLAQWHAERRAKRPKPAKLVADERLREYVQDRLAGNVVHALDGRVVEGPQVPPWQGRNKPRRQDRRWATSWRARNRYRSVSRLIPRSLPMPSKVWRGSDRYSETASALNSGG
ncbi:hypothetical protein B9S64_16415 [Streptomyces sp. SM18]|nr:hypothetical protein B9S64_16415 [Streptomyces sp. SM18]